MVRDSVAFLRAQGRRVFFDAEHFFDGYRTDPDFAMAVLAAAEEAGAERLVLCDTNGGMLPFDVARVVGQVDDAGRGAARDPRAQRRRLRRRELADRRRRRGAPGAGHDQRLRRAHRQRRPDPDHRRPRAEDGRRATRCPTGAVGHLTELAHFVAEIANLPPEARASPTRVATRSPTRRGCTRAASRGSRARTSTCRPRSVGNRRGVVASDYGGGATIRMKAEEFGLDARPTPRSRPRSSRSRSARRPGYAFDVAEASLELLLRARRRLVPAVLRGRELPRARRGARGRRRGAARRGDGEGARRRAPGTSRAPRARGRSARSTTRCARRSRTTTRSSTTWSSRTSACGCSTRASAPGAVVRVLIDTSNGEREWTTVGVSENIIEASWEALVDGYTYGLLHPRTSGP